jgi:hypothetical protein
MATKKKTTADSTSASVIKEKKTKNSEAWPKVVKGTHLTVTTYQDGTTKLEWDDEALLSEVRNAILKHESTIPVTAVKKTKKKTVKETK